MRDGVIRGGEDGAVRVVRCGQAVGGTVCEGRSARSNRSTGALGELSCRHRAVVLTPDEMRKSSAGRKPLDAIVMFRMLVLQALNNLSDEQVEYMSTSRTPGPSFWSRTISTSIARRHSTKPSRPPKPGGWSSASNGTTPQSTAVGSIWRSPNSASYRPSASTAGFPIKEPSSRKSPPGRRPQCQQHQSQLALLYGPAA